MSRDETWRIWISLVRKRGKKKESAPFNACLLYTGHTKFDAHNEIPLSSIVSPNYFSHTREESWIKLVTLRPS